MNQEDRTEFFALITVLENYYDRPISAERHALYFKHLEKYPFPDVKRAADKLVESSKFFPAVSEFIEALNGTSQEKASNAWYEYYKALDAPGIYASLDMGDPIAHKVILELNLWGSDIDQYGYPDQRITGTQAGYCRCQQKALDELGSYTMHSNDCEGGLQVQIKKDQRDFLRVEFIKRYTYHSNHSDIRTLPRYVSGITETENRRAIASGADRYWTNEQREMAIPHPLPVGAKPAPASRKQLPAQVDRKQLPAPKFEDMPAEIKQLIQKPDLRIVKPIHLSEEQLKARQEELRKQKEQLGVGK
ncbi:MAG: hypothetical protein LC778_19795 [Acidobacteria bacterium]|nr:hypothetical protein [Acidobacteriota bacterium]